jgi:hypothetical protein
VLSLTSSTFVAAIAVSMMIRSLPCSLAASRSHAFQFGSPMAIPWRLA